MSDDDDLSEGQRADVRAAGLEDGASDADAMNTSGLPMDLLHLVKFSAGRQEATSSLGL